MGMRLKCFAGYTHTLCWSHGATAQIPDLLKSGTAFRLLLWWESSAGPSLLSAKPVFAFTFLHKAFSKSQKGSSMMEERPWQKKRQVRKGKVQEKTEGVIGEAMER